ncbi:haloacid dehalogenase superfamily, subfamily IA, variant 3 with third motif having DD or ED/beta-phosphoglucomutase family hydrolase [Georgenia satyanarayanai]|uniref:Beta-phosphoglucomutase n=1 Tax=Georgenia satyanarayanai TaxID=860221 RepID=A0A2Y9ANW5_9MICO|nr:beta-phosphoglucomutase family hydrolase [Georgenia satyanarayanai]PYF99087.1 HAD superfamily hydrolase (TIGR01509 family)/beta-phosphoglucomutase family hydrolase [Georgenia satyanarayanai]SSA44049.1 haloacid dehalogenase superfamily, subfamily IA, variant 3 with third motif having DD or ED/beta-phosphoglucomutase family hydrolase [Georgenia satyanarayanai]
MLGLPDSVRALLFDLDGVLTRTAALHARAWTETFDEFLRDHAGRTGEPFVPFDPVAEYAAHVDGKRRVDGVRDFLGSRDITLPTGTPTDSPERETLNGIGNRKNERVLRLITTEGVEVFPGSLRYLDAAREAGLTCAVVSSSANAALVLDVTGLEDRIDVLVDGSLAHALDLPGKPAPDTFLEATRRLGLTPREAAVVEDALAGVAAGRAGRFGYVIGVDRLGQADALREKGADVVVADLEELL